MPAAMVPQRRTLLFLPVVLAISTGCPKRIVDFGKDGEPRSAEELLKRITFAESQIYALKGDARLGVDSPQGKGSVTLFAAVAHPAFIHLEQLDFFGRPQGVLVTDGTRFGLYNSQDGKYYRGPASPANLGRFLPVVMPPKELAAVMLGRAPRIPVDSLEMRFDDGKQLLVLVINRGKVRQTLLVQPPSYRVVKSTAENLTAYDLSFGDIVTENGVTLPKEAHLDAKIAKTSVDLIWKDVAINEAPDLTLFEMEPPEGVEVIEVDANGDPARTP
jgi:hypothetical protein